MTRSAWERCFWLIFLAAAAAWSLATPDPAALEAEGRERNNHAWELYLQGRTHEGLAEVERALELLPGDIAALDTRGALLAQAGRWEEAEADFRAALERDPGNGVIRTHLQVTLVVLWRTTEARSLQQVPTVVCGDGCELCQVRRQPDFEALSLR